MKRIIALAAVVLIVVVAFASAAPSATDSSSTGTPASSSVVSGLALDSLQVDSALVAEAEATDFDDLDMEGGSLHQQLKKQFIDGSPLFMSLVALALVLGLAFCIERIVYLTLSEIDAKRMMRDIDAKVEDGDVEGAKQLCRDTRGPVASICYQGLMHINESMDDIERSVISYGSVQTAKLEKGTSWIKLFIAIAPSLGFLGTVIGMVIAFEQIQIAGDIGPTIVAAGMKVALITTIFGIVVALILQLFYSYITSKIEHLTSQMEESAVTLLDIIMKYKKTKPQKQ
jgi:biopolymer transport protein ExbB